MKIDVLDRGYVELIDSYGSDSRIIEAARMSTDKGFQGWKLPCKNCQDWEENDERICENCQDTCEVEGDTKLLKYLYKNKHMTPFEMCDATFIIQAPIFVFREWHRHRTQSYNEMSARYTPLPNMSYIPTMDRIGIDGGSNKQAQGVKELTNSAATEFVVNLEKFYINVQRLYQKALEDGIPKELARLVLPVGRYSRMMAKANLRNWLGFLILRMDSHAQWEIRQYANAVHQLLSQKFPRTMALYDEEFNNAHDS